MNDKKLEETARRLGIQYDKPNLIGGFLNAMSDSWQRFGLITSSLALFLLIARIGQVELIRVFSLLHQFYAGISHYFYEATLFWLHFDAPPWLRETWSLYCLIGSAAARATYLYASAGSTGFTSGRQIFVKIVQWFFTRARPLSSVICLLVVAPLWPLVLMSSPAQVVLNKRTKRIWSGSLRDVFIPILLGTILGSFSLLAFNALIELYGDFKR